MCLTTYCMLLSQFLICLNVLPVVLSYKLSLQYALIDQLNEGTSNISRIFLIDCDDPSNSTHVSTTIIEGQGEELTYPRIIYNVTCCPNVTALQDYPSCGAPLNLHGNSLGFVALRFCDVEDLDNCANLDVGVIRPPHNIIDTVYVYVLISGTVLITLCFGSTLDIEKVKTYMKKPIVPCIGLACQFMIMPLVGFTLATIIDRHAALKFGVFAAAVAPGGGASNIWSYLLGGDLDLSITMTFISSIAALGFIPFWTYTLGAYILGDSDVKVPFTKMAETLAYIIVPLLAGLLINKYLKKVARILGKLQKIFIVGFVLFAASFGIYSNIYAFKMVFSDYQLLLCGMFLPYLGGACGLLVSFLLRREKPVIITIGIETAIQNSSIATYLLRQSLPPPWGDISSAIPVCLTLLTPWPLYIAGIIRLVHIKCTGGSLKILGYKSSTYTVEDVNGSQEELKPPLQTVNDATTTDTHDRDEKEKRAVSLDETYTNSICTA